MEIERAALPLLLVAAAIGVGCIGPGPAPGPPVMVAGWDFSPYLSDGALSVDGEHLLDTLDANYSDFDPTLGAGAEAAAFGTMHLDGRFGSTDTPLDYEDPLLPSAAARGSLGSNLRAPAGVRFDCFRVLRKEGQGFAGPLTMTALRPVDVVFEADLGSVPEQGRDWSVSLGGRTSVGRVPLRVEFSTDGSSFRRYAELELTEEDTPIRVQLGGARSDRAFVRLHLAPDPVATRYQQAFIDNVAIHAHLVLPAGASPTPLVQATPFERECR